MLNDILLRTKGTELYIFYPVIRLRISFVNVITTPPARVRNPLERCDGRVFETISLPEQCPKRE